MPRLGTQTVGIANNGTLSGTITLRGADQVLVATAGPLTAGTYSYQISPDGGATWMPARNASGSALTTLVAGTVAWALPAELLAASQVRLVAGAAEGAARTFTVLSKGD